MFVCFGTKKMKNPNAIQRRVTKKISFGPFQCTLESDCDKVGIKESGSIPQELQHYIASLKFCYEAKEGVFKNTVLSIDTLLFDWKKLEDLLRKTFDIPITQDVSFTYTDEGKSVLCANNNDLHVLFSLYKHLDANRKFKDLPMQMTCTIKTVLQKPVRNWDVQEKLGSGAFGMVYRVFDTDQGRIMACKQIDLTKSNKKAVRLLFIYFF